MITLVLDNKELIEWRLFLKLVEGGLRRSKGQKIENFAFDGNFIP